MVAAPEDMYIEAHCYQSTLSNYVRSNQLLYRTCCIILIDLLQAVNLCALKKHTLEGFDNVQPNPASERSMATLELPDFWYKTIGSNCMLQLNCHQEKKERSMGNMVPELYVQRQALIFQMVIREACYCHSYGTGLLINGFKCIAAGFP